MNVLYLAHRIPYPPNKGDKLRAFHQIQRLSRHHRVWCACFVDSLHDSPYVAALAEHCHKLAVVRLRPALAKLRGAIGLARGGTVTESYYRSAAMRTALSAWTRSTTFDSVVAFSSSMAPYALAVPARRRVLDLCDLDSRKWLDYAARSPFGVAALYRAEGKRLAMRELTWLNAFDATLLITQQEAKPLSQLAPTHKLHIVGNGVTLPDRTAAETRQRETGPPVVGFVGVMNYRPNVDAVTWFVDACWPTIRNRSPNAVFRIVGRSPARAVRRLATRPGVHVVGEVHDVFHDVTRFDVSVAPLRIARGLQNKVLEAMAAAKPVVLTPAAATGIDARADHEFVIAQEADDIADAVVQLLADPAMRARVGTAARQFVATHHSWPRVLDEFEWIATGALSRSAGCPAAAELEHGGPVEQSIERMRTGR